MSSTNSSQFQPITARPMPGRRTGIVAWLRANLFSGPINSLMTLATVALLAWSISHAFDWAVARAVFGAQLEACNNARGLGACWGVIAEKGRLIVMGRYPDTEHWRPVIATTLMLLVVGASCMHVVLTNVDRRSRCSLLAAPVAEREGEGHGAKCGGDGREDK